MKKVFIAIAILFSISVKAQNYADSIINVQIPQRFSFYIGKYVQQSLFNVNTRTLPDLIKPYFGKNQKPDSLFSVSIKAGWLQGGLEVMMGQDIGGAVDDYNVTIYNFPAVPLYTSLSAQVQTKAAGNTSEKQVATWLFNWFVARKSEKQGPIVEAKNQMVNW